MTNDLAPDNLKRVFENQAEATVTTKDLYGLLYKIAFWVQEIYQKAMEKDKKGVEVLKNKLPDLSEQCFDLKLCIKFFAEQGVVGRSGEPLLVRQPIVDDYWPENFRDGLHVSIIHKYFLKTADGRSFLAPAGIYIEFEENPEKYTSEEKENLNPGPAHPDEIGLLSEEDNNNLWKDIFGTDKK